MKPSNPIRDLIIIWIVVVTCSGVGRAGPMEITIDNAFPNGLFLGAIQSSGSDAAGFGSMNPIHGLSIFVRRVSGTLGGELTTVDGYLNLTFSGDLALLDGNGVQIGTLMITHAVIYNTANGFAAGSIDFSLAFGTAPGEVFSGAWYFTADGFGMRSRLWETGFQLFGQGPSRNSDDNNTHQNVRPTSGVDLKAGMEQVPEASTLTYLAAVVLLTGLFLVWRFWAQLKFRRF